MEQRKLILTVGLPRSGKSTWAKTTGFPIVNPDSIRIALYGQPFLKDAEEMVWTIAKYMVKSLFIAGHNIVILDACNITVKDRNKWLGFNNYNFWDTYYKVFNTSYPICSQRALNEGNQNLVDIIVRMYKKSEILTLDEEKYIYE